ncbi:MAG: gliding motility-associated-like protein [Cyclobacteriaceae bacterium]|jgi:gliding motility-associated-like protein
MQLAFTRKLTLATLLVLNYLLSIGQIIPNMSFEGAPQINTPPMSWTPCDAVSTPDTQPGFWEEFRPASHGDTYLGMVTRGNDGPYANINEDIEVKLLAPIRVGASKSFTIDLAISDDWGHIIGFGSTFLSYNNPTKLQIYGGTTSCEKFELLWESPTIGHYKWETYKFSLTPTLGEIGYLLFRPEYIGETTYFGNILLDNIQNCSFDFELFSDTTICENQPLIVDVSVENGEYIWQDDSTDPVYEITSAGTYKVVISNGCISRDYAFDVNIRNCKCDNIEPIQLMAYDTLICVPDSVVLNAMIPNGKYLWNDGSTNSALVVSSQGSYQVEISNGCETENLTFGVETIRCDCNIEAPNVFTPNGDGYNESFEISGSVDIAKYNLIIYNRIGNVVYETDQVNEYWDGTFQGNPVQDGVYFWYAQLACIQKNTIVDNTIKGVINVIR